MSHPTWVRGLKQFVLALQKYVNVAPYVGAWIETLNEKLTKEKLNVAPYVGAWIETLMIDILRRLYGSRTLRGCVD